MAIDTAEKRRSAANVDGLGAPGVTPNASKDQEWRQQSGWGYSGILASAPVAFFQEIILFDVAIQRLEALDVEL